jgi:predicted transposase YdaD
MTESRISDRETSDNESEKHNPHDAAFKSVFQKKELAVSFFRTYLPADIIGRADLDSSELVGKSYVDENMKELHSDIVYRTRLMGKDAFLYLLFEHQSTPDYWIIFRLLCYMTNLWRSYREQYPKKRRLPVIIPLVFYHGRRRWKAPFRFTELFTEPGSFSMFVPDFTYMLYDSGKYDDDPPIPDEPALNAVVYLFRHIFDDDFGEDKVGKLVMLLSAIQDYRKFYEFWNWAFRYACEARRDDKDRLLAAITGVTGNTGDGRVKMAAMTIADQFRQEGWKEGRQEGRQEGWKEALLKMLKKRFGKISPFLEEKLKLSGQDILDKFTDLIFEFTDLSDAEKWWELHDRKPDIQ